MKSATSGAFHGAFAVACLVLFGTATAPTASAAGAASTPADVSTQAAALIAPDDPATGDPPPPDGAAVPDGLDEPAPVPDESVVEFPPPLGEVRNGTLVAAAWVGTPAQRPQDASGLLTLQAAVNAATTGATVSIDPGAYAFTGPILVSRSVSIASSAAATLYGRFTISSGSVRFADEVAIGAASTGAVVSVTGSGVALVGLAVLNPNGVARPTGIQLAAGVTGVVIDDFTMDGGGQASTYGVNLTTGAATITDADISGVATGITVAATAPTTGIVITGGHINASTSGISLGKAVEPVVDGVDVTGPEGVGTGIDLANSGGAVVDDVTVQGFARGIGTSTTNPEAGPTITDATIVGTSREGIALGATVGASVVRADITGTGINQSTGILVLLSSDTRIEEPTITGMMYGVSTQLQNTRVGPVITAPRITAFGAVTLGSTQGAVVSDAVLDAGTWGPSGTGINLVNAGRVTIVRESATGFLYAIGSQSSLDEDSDRTDISISDLTVDGAQNASSGVYLLGVVNATITDIDAALTGAALVIHQSVGVNAQDIVVHGRQGPTSVTGAAILRAYGSQNVNVDNATLDTGSYGFFYSGTDGSTVTNATVTGVVERALYGRSVANLDVSASTFTGNSAVGLFVVTTPENGISHDIAVHDNVMADNVGGIDVLQGTTRVQVIGNTVSGQSGFVTAGGAHDLLIAGNTVDQSADAVAIVVRPLWQDGAEPGSYSSSGIQVQGNTFSGGGSWISVGSPDPAAPDAARRSLRDPVLVTGNVFPAASTAVQTYANAVVGEDAAGPAARALPVDGPIAVDARDYDDPNDWGSECRATGYLDGAPYYQGDGAVVYELTDAPVLYPMDCIDLSLAESPEVADGEELGVGDLMAWTLTPHNAGPGPAPAGWTITQLLPETVELVSMAGEGYSVIGTTATAERPLPPSADGPALRVVARIVSIPSGETTIRNDAYIAPAGPTDVDGDGFADDIFERLSPLVVPTLDTDTDASATDNDAQGVWYLAGPAPAPTPGGGTSTSGLSGTGVDPVPMIALALLLVFVGLSARGYRARSPRDRGRPSARC